MINKKIGIIISILGVISIALIATGITYAFFNYAGVGLKENTITSGSITFMYEEIDKLGSGIAIENAYPIPDASGKILTATNEVFNFSVKSTTSSGFEIPYTITARKDNSSTLTEEAVKIYLTEVEGTTEKQILLNNYDKLPSTEFIDNSIIEKIIHTDTVPQDSVNYVKNYKLRMWIDDNIKFSPTQDENGNDIYEYNNKTFKITINVYADAEIVTVPMAPATMNSETELSIGDAVTAVDGSKWHVLESSVSGEDTVVLLSDYNLNSDGTYNTTCGKEIDNNYFCNNMMFDPDDTNTYDELDENNIGYFIKNTYGQLVTTSLPGTTNVTLPTASQIASADGKVFNDSTTNLSASWLLTTTYWTKTIYSSLDVWAVAGTMSVIYNESPDISYSFGARPVITTLKTNLLAE